MTLDSGTASAGEPDVDEVQLPIEGVAPEEHRSRPLSRKRGAAPPRPDPLQADQARSLLVSSRVIRDPVHHDIRVTEFELRLIDSEAFQRLRLIDQLAMVDLVYPGAVHTRFLHSLGTLHVCSELVRSCNNSVKALGSSVRIGDPAPVKIGPYAEFLGRLVALLHDLAHVAFGHVFEREAQVFEKDEWEDAWRLKQTLGSDSPFAVVFKEALAELLTQLPGQSRMTQSDAGEAAERVLSEVREIITAKGQGVLRLRYPFIADLVGNTICADLLDYVRRDMYFCGLTEGLATRFLNYLAVIPVRYVLPGADAASGGPNPTLEPVREAAASEAQPLSIEGRMAVGCRAVFVYYRYNSRKAANTKENVLSEAIDLVRTRKQAAEKLYFHKTKLTATSMLAAAAHASGIHSAEPIWNLSDHEVLKLIRDGLPGPQPTAELGIRRRARAKKIAEDLLARRLFKPIFRLSWHPNIDDAAGRSLWDPATGVYTRFSNPAARETVIESLEKAIEANVVRKANGAAGTVSISCPNKNMQLKPFEMLVLATPSATEVGPLEETVRPSIKAEIDVVKQQHEELWRMEVLVDPRVVDLSSEFAQQLAGAIQSVVGMNNELPEFHSAPVESIDRLIRRGEVNAALEHMGLVDRISNVRYGQLVSGAIAARGGTDIETQLREWYPS